MAEPADSKPNDIPDPTFKQYPTIESLTYRLQTRVWSTSSARFNAARRLHRFHASSTYATTLLNVLIVGGALLAGSDSKAVSSFLVVASMLVLAVQLLDQSESPKLTAVILHDCATKLNSLYSRIEIRRAQNQPITHSELDAFQQEYDSVIEMTRVNHKPVDYQRFLLEHNHPDRPSKQTSWAFRFGRRISIEVRSEYPLIFHWLATVGTMVWLARLT